MGSVVKSKRRALVLEDDEGVRWSLETILSHFGFEVNVAANSSQFIVAINNDSHFDLMVTDFNLNETAFDGLMAIQTIRKKEPQLPIVMITAEALSHPRISQLLGTRRLAILEKPFDLTTLMKAFSELGVSTE